MNKPTDGKPTDGKPADGRMVLLGEENSGRDEMNLAGNPFALLQSASRGGQSFIKNEWERTLPSGKIVIARWEVNGHAELGLPGPNEELLYLVLLQITREAADENGIWPRKVYFSRKRVLSLLGWGDSAKTYKTLRDCFVRLNNVAITADNAFWDARTKTPHPTVSFGIINEFTFSTEIGGRKGQGSAPRSWFEWNMTVYESFLAGNVRSLALDFILSLDLPTTRRLFRFLDMMRGSTTPPRREFAIGVFKLCDKLGMTSYKYVSKSKEKLQPAINELKERNYLEDVRFQKAKDGTEIAFFRFAAISRGDTPASEQSAPDGSIEVIYAPPADTQFPETRQTALFESSDVSESPEPTGEPTEQPTPEPTGIRLDALRCHAFFQTLSEAEQTELMEIAKREVSPIWHDRIGQSESPMSLGLWKLVMERYGDRVG